MVPSWDGFHLGLALGTRATDASSLTTTAAGTGGTIAPNPDSALARFDNVAGRLSAFLGYDWQFARTWVAGVEGDIGWANSRKSVFGLPGSYGNFGGAHVPPRTGDGVDFQATWEASLRGRLGYLLTDAVMVYGTGGVAWQHVQMTASCGGLCLADLVIPANSDPQSTTRMGYTVGGGIESKLSGNWLVRAEYRYADFGTWKPVWHADAAHFAAADVQIKTHTALVGISYKLGASASGAAAQAYASAASAPAFSWSGYYAGLNLGARSSDAKWTTTSITETSGNVVLEDATKTAAFDSTAARYGAYLGINWQIAPMWLAGVEADFGWGNQRRSVFGVPGTFGENSGLTAQPRDFAAVRATWDASLRARVGYLMTPSLLGYATAGPSWLHVERTLSCGGTCSFNIGGLPEVTVNQSTTRLGWTVGGGIETALPGNWLARAEYRFADYGTWSSAWSFDPTFNGVAEVHIKTHTAQIGLAYKFAGGMR